ncbi:MAG: thioester reductase domain-containing protein [Kofleriaceae bacterium]|nr:thioester reductase domain-containing protein [Kofleriaceae bacterium]
MSSFGMGGTNAHVVLGVVDAVGARDTTSARRASALDGAGPAALIPVSARSAAALEILVARTQAQLATHSPADVAHSAGVRRDHHDHRSAIVAGTHSSPIAAHVAPRRPPRLVLVFPDRQPLDAGFAAALAEEDPPFAAELERRRRAGEPELAARQGALTAVLRAVGLEPAHVLQGTTQAATSLGDDGTVFVELSQQAAMADELRAVLARAGAPGTVVSLAAPGLGPRASLLRVIGSLYCLGFAIEWRLLDAPGARFVRLGTYPWQREACVAPAPLAPPAVVASAMPPVSRADEVLVASWEPAGVAPRQRVPGDWVVLGPAALAGALARALAGSGLRVRPGDAGDAGANLVVLAGTDLASTLALVQAVAARADVSCRLWLVTRGAAWVGAEPGVIAAAAAAPAWGLGRVVMNECPRLRCTLVDLSAGGASDDLRADEVELLARELVAGDDEREVAIRGRTRYVARLRRRQLGPASALVLRPEAAYLVTGGLGGLGLAAAGRLAARGAGALVLLSRRGVVTAEARRGIAALTEAGAKVVVERADVADRRALAGVLERHAVRGVIHAAGVMSPGAIPSISGADLPAALAAKVDGARHLHELTAGRPLDFFILYSSIATMLGMPGQGAYAAANAYLDALAAHRRAAGLPAVSVAWTVIEGAGMAARAGDQALGQLRDRGLTTLSVEGATDVLERLLGPDVPAQVGVVGLELARWTRFYGLTGTSGRLRPLAADPAAAGPVANAPAGAAAALAVSSPGADASPRSEAAIEVLLIRAVGAVLHDVAPDPTRPLRDLGMDSLTAVELQELVAGELGVELASERLGGTITIRELARELAAELRGEARAPAAPAALRDDARLDPAITFTTRAPGPPRSVLLTGATGFLGAFVLAELLARSQAEVVCLVRAGSERDAMRRLEATLARYDLPALDLGARVTCVPGDLERPRLGVDDYEGLVGSIDTIVHSGASVNFIASYQELRAANVDGTREVLRLAAAARARLHYVSTIGVFPGGTGAVAAGAVLERDRASDPDRLPLGYMRAKWVAEALVEQARARGLDVSIYRPGTIAGHARSGAFNPDDFVCALIKGCVQLGLAPQVDAPVNLVPVDYVSRALVHLALGGVAGTYHLVGRRAVGWGELVAWIRALGYPLAELPYAEWRGILRGRAVATGNALAPLLPLFVEHDDTEWLRLPSYDDTQARAALRGAGVECPPVDAALVRRYVERFVVSGYLPRP